MGSIYGSKRSVWKLFVLDRNRLHHEITQLAQIFLTLSHHSSLSSIAPNRSTSLHPVSIQRCCRYVLHGCPTLACPCEGVHRKISLVISFLLLQWCPACLVHLTWMVLEIGGRWPYNCCFMGCCFKDLYNTVHSILVQLLSSFFVSMLCIHTVELTQLLFGRNHVLLYRIG